MYGTNGSGLQFGEQAYYNNGTPTHGNLNFHGIFMTSSFIFLQGEGYFFNTNFLSIQNRIF